MHLQHLFLAGLASGLAAASRVLDLTPKNFDAEVFAGTPTLVEFFAPWCGHCKNLAPVYEELADSYANAISSDKIKIAKVDADAHKDLGTKFDISGFPTLKYFDGTSKEPIDYPAGRGLEDFQNWLKEKTGVKAKTVPKPPSAVEHLTDKTFDQVVGQDKSVFVAFTAPWCGHCKTLAPVWEKVASDFVGDSKHVSIAKVDAEANKKVAQEYGIASYPTIKFFPAGSKTPLNYTGGRSEALLLEYVNENTGLNRVVGGDLGLKAGTIEAFDAIVAKLSEKGEDAKKAVEDATAEVQKTAKGIEKSLKNNYAEYYLRVLGKLKENEGYAIKEMGRLEGILKKGGLTRDKADDLKSRLNILTKFIPRAAGDESKDEL